MSDDFEHARECLDKARYWLGQAMIATRKAKETEKNKTILNERCEKIRRLYERCDNLVTIDFWYDGCDEREVRP